MDFLCDRFSIEDNINRTSMEKNAYASTRFGSLSIDVRYTFDRFPKDFQR